MIKKLSVSIALVISIFTTIYAEDSPVWFQLSGKWKIEQSHLSETRGWPNRWWYYELLNHNTIISTQDMTDYDSINFSVNLSGSTAKQDGSPSVFTLFWGAQRPDANWFFHFYGVQFTGDASSIQKVSIIFSDRIDMSKPYATKKNYYVKELASSNHPLSYNQNLQCYLRFTDMDVSFYINNEKIITFAANELKDTKNGRVGFSSSYCLPSIEYVNLMKNKEKIFEDGFDVNSMFVPTARATVEKNK